jgi:hypothetical protein
MFFNFFQEPDEYQSRPNIFRTFSNLDIQGIKCEASSIPAGVVNESDEPSQHSEGFA